MINLYGNASLTIGSGVGITSGQTINFDTNLGTVTRSALDGSAQIGGFLTGDGDTQNLGTSATPTFTTVLGNGEATVEVLEGSTIVDEGDVPRQASPAPPTSAPTERAEHERWTDHVYSVEV